MKVENQKLSEPVYSAELEQVRALYHTGKEVDLYEAVDYHKKMSSKKNLSKAEEWERM